MFLKREPMGIMSKTDELPVAQPTVSNHSREFNTTMPATQDKPSTGLILAFDPPTDSFRSKSRKATAFMRAVPIT